MAVSASALTLGQYAIQSNDPLVQRVVYSLIQNGSILDEVPIVTKATMLANGVRFEGNLPTVNWRKINEDPTVTSGTPTPFQEQVYLLNNAIDVDNVLLKDQNRIQDPRALQLDAYLKAVAYDMNDKFINNNHVTGDADAFVGLRARIDSPSTYGVRTENKIDGGGVDMTTANMTTTTANNFIEFLDQLLWSVGSLDGTGVVLYMNEVMKRRFARALRVLGTAGGFTITQDMFGRTVEKFRNATLKDIGYKADQSTRIITNTEANTGAAGASTYTSIYAVHYGTEQLMAWQMDELRPEYIGRVGNGGNTDRTIIDWQFGLYPNTNRCMARLYGIKMS